jgi:hypothetical protein
VVNRLENLKSISESLYSDSDRSVFHVGIPGFWNRVMISINDSVKILGDSCCDLVKFMIVECLGLGINKSGQRNGCQIANSHFISTGKLDDFSAEI